MSLTPPKSLGQPPCSAKNTDVMICSIMVSVTWEKCYFELRWVLPCHDFAPHGTWNLLGEGWVLGRSFAGSQLCVQPFSLFGPWCRTGRILLLESSVSQGSQHKTGSCKRLHALSEGQLLGGSRHSVRLKKAAVALSLCVFFHRKYFSWFDLINVRSFWSTRDTVDASVIFISLYF